MSKRNPWDKKETRAPSAPTRVEGRQSQESLWPCPPPTPAQVAWDTALTKFLAEEKAHG